MLNKIPLRIMFRNKSQFFGIIFLVFLASFFYSLFSILISNIDMNYKDFVDKYKQESFHFITLIPINVEEISNKFNLEIEERFSWDYEYDSKTLRIFSLSSKVNKPLISEGKLPSLGEIAIDPNFAQANNLKIGDSFQIQGKTFRISGFCFLPDYIYIIKNEQDFLPDSLHFGIGVLNYDDLVSHMPPSVFLHYYMARGDTDIDSLKQELASKYGLLRFQEKWDNFRIIVTEKKMESARPMSYVIAGIILFISSILLSIVLSRLIRSMHREIGTLYALGYNRKEIMSVYIKFPIIIWLTGSIPGILLGYLFSDPFIRFYVSFITVPVVHKIFSYSDFILALILPGAFIIPTGYFCIRNLLKKSVVEIIRGEEEKGFKKKYRFNFLDRFSFRRRLMLKQALLHPSREIILIFGLAFASFLILYGVSARSSLYRLPEKTYKEIFRYNYMYLFNNYKTKNNWGGERFNLLNFTIGNSRANVSIYGIEKNSELIYLTDKEGNRLYPDGLIISKSLADKFNLKLGDTVEFKDKITGNKYYLKVKEIADLYVGNSAYMDIDEFNNTFNQEKGTFIGLFSKDKLDIPKEELLTVMDKEYIIEVFKNNASTIDQMIRFLGIASFLVALCIVYVLSSLTITENRKPLALFKILGYYDKELSSIFLGFNDISFVIGFLLGIPLFNYFMNLLMKNVLKDLDFSLELKTSFQDIIIAFLILLVAFVISKYFGRKKIYSISPSIILKEQME